MKTAIHILAALASSFILWVLLEAAGIGMALEFYLVCWLLWSCGPWILRGLTGRQQ